MARTRLFSLLEGKVDQQINSVGESILRGDLKNYDEYRDWVGYVRGLRDALKLADEIEGELDQ